MYSIRKKLTLTIVIGMILVLSVTTVFLYYLIVREVQTVFDSALLDKAHAMITLTELDHQDGLEFDFTEGMMPEFETGADAQYYQLWERGTDPLVKSPSLGKDDLPLIVTPPGEHRFADLTLADGKTGRLISINFLPRLDMDEDDEEAKGVSNAESQSQAKLPIPQPITLVFARERESLDQMLLTIGITISTIMLLVLAISGLMVRGFVGKGLAPLSSLAQQLGEIDESSLGSRISHEGEQSIELAPIENQINHLIERLQSAFEREKRFSSNVAHELRTPLTELRTLAEVGQLAPEERDQVIGFFNDVSDISRQMENIVITLLELARSDAGLLEANPEDFLLDAYCSLVWQQVIDGQGRERVLVNNIPSDLVVNTDREKLGMILGNLFTNAVSYSPVNADIRIDVEIRHDKVAIKVRNSAIDLRPEDILHMRDRFWRKQKANVTAGHSGLGLSLVEALANIMNLNVNLQLDDNKDFLVTISGLSAA